MKKELRGFSSFFAANKREVIVLTSATLFFTLAYYHPVGNDTPWNDAFTSALYYLVLPLIVVLLLRQNPLDFGLGLGQIKTWCLYVVIICLVLTPILFITARSSAFQVYYAKDNFNFINYCDFLINKILPEIIKLF